MSGKIKGIEGVADHTLVVAREMARGQAEKFIPKVVPMNERWWSGSFLERSFFEMIRLSVNVNKIATIRNARGGDIPSVVEAASTCIAAGCHGITVHPRPDARHITFQDVFDLAAMMTVEFNIEGYPTAEFVDLVMKVRPTQVTLVPDPPGVLTSSAGWNLTSGAFDWLRDVLASFRDTGIRTSLFLETDAAQIERAQQFGADRIELYTGPYAHAFGTPEGTKILAAHR